MTRPTLMDAVVIVCCLFAAGAGVGWYARHRASGDLTAHADSLATVMKARDTASAQAAVLAQRALVEQGRTAVATIRADSLLALAERHRWRNRVVDSAHVAITTSDTDHVAHVVEVPVEITQQLALDSAALAAEDLRGNADSTLLAVRVMEVSTLETQVHLDSLAIHHLQSEVADLTALKSPRFTFTEGVVATVSVVALLKLLALLLGH